LEELEKIKSTLKPRYEKKKKEAEEKGKREEVKSGKEKKVRLLVSPIFSRLMVYRRKKKEMEYQRHQKMRRISLMKMMIR